MRNEKNRNHRSWLSLDTTLKQLTSCFLFSLLASQFAHLLGPASHPVLTLLPGVLLAFLLLTPHAAWFFLTIAAFAAQLLPLLFISSPVGWMVLTDPLLQCTEGLLGGLLLRSCWMEFSSLSGSSFLLRFWPVSVLALPFVFASPTVQLQSQYAPESFAQRILYCAIAHGLGTALVTPALIALFSKNPFELDIWKHCTSKQLILLPLCILLLAQPTLPLLLLVLPLLALTYRCFDTERAVQLLLFLAITAVLLTASGHGALYLFATAHGISAASALQLFCAEGILLVYSISSVLDHHRSTEHNLEKIAALHALVSENSRDAIILSDMSGKRSYGSAAAEKFGGWRPEDLLTEEGLEPVHPADRPRVHAIIDELRAGSAAATLECRVRQSSEGEYLWIEVSLSMVRDPQSGQPSGVLNFIRDISVRKNAEISLREAYDAVEALSVTDPLTGLANRRRFDKYLHQEWRRAIRTHEPLSLLMVDVDNFKKYNDTYGHPRGDNCLKQIAEAALDVAMRSTDLVARFGGEEFVVVLPSTDHTNALHVAGELCAAVRDRQLPHSQNILGVVTVSVGGATLIPNNELQMRDLIEMADQAVYAAKQAGRNQVCSGNNKVDSSNLISGTT
ncbi:diguanylate cyclase [Telmatobacter bradus]|uniref:GGDEF domain-containing protein n=1 Tax=Telmatobacter bradus TaxID=474953 RepID=UPI003B43B34E